MGKLSGASVSVEVVSLLGVLYGRHGDRNFLEPALSPKPGWQAFKNYDEAGERRRIQCLKYLVLANMLMESKVDPFDAQEAKPYKNDNEIMAMTTLVEAYQQNDISTFERTLKNNRCGSYQDRDSGLRSTDIVTVQKPC